MTKKEMYVELIAMVNASDVDSKEEILEKLDREIEILSKKRVYKSAKKNEENESLKGIIFGAMENQPNRLFRPTEISKLFDYEYSCQKVTSILSMLCDDGKVEKITEKKATYYKVA